MDSMIDEEDDELWDELNIQQSREIQQYHQGVWTERRYIIHRTVSYYFNKFIRQTKNELNQLGSIVYDAASDAYYEQRIKQQERRYQYNTAIKIQQQQNQFQSHNNGVAATQQMYNNANNGITNFDEFGLLDFGGQSTQENSNDNIELDQLLSHKQQKKKKKGGWNDFIFLDNIRSRTSKRNIEDDGYASVSNLDVYFNTLYSFYYNRGLIPIVTRGIIELITLFFTLLLSIFLFLYLDWYTLMKCHDENTCYNDFNLYIIKYPFYTNHHYIIWKCIVLLYCIIFIIYSILSILSFIHTIQDAIYAKYIFTEKLGISERKLLIGAIDWDYDIVSKLISLQQSGEYRIIINDDNNHTQLNALYITNRILRKENFLIALFNRGYLDLSVPFLNNQQGTTFYCSSIEWCIYFCVLNFMFNHKYELRPAFYMEPDALRKRFQLCGILHFIFMPFLLFFLCLYFGLQNVYDWKSTKQYLGPREWSNSAKWIFREFNELPHLFERRLLKSYEPAETYINLFGSNEIIAAFGRILTFIGGSIGLVILLFATMNDAIVLHVKIGDWNLLWYAGIAGAIYSTGKAMIPTINAQPKSTRNLYNEMNEALIEVSNHTHYFPSIWKGRGWHPLTHAKFSSMFQYKAKLFANEIISLILSPYILYVSLANCSEVICEFVLAIRSNIPGAGDVCGYATFDFNKFNDESYFDDNDNDNDGGHNHNNNNNSSSSQMRTDPLAVSLAESIYQTGNVDEAVRRFPTPTTRYGKMKNSYMSFKATHPSWQPFESGRHLVDMTHENERAQYDAFNQEQELHRDAAVRQLETLRRLEEGLRPSDNILPVRRVIDSHIPRSGGTAAPADAGAGSGQF